MSNFENANNGVNGKSKPPHKINRITHLPSIEQTPQKQKRAFIDSHKINEQSFELGLLQDNSHSFSRDDVDNTVEKNGN